MTPFAQIRKFFADRAARKRAKACLAAARTYLYTNEDVMAAEDAAGMRRALAARDSAAAESLLARLSPPQSLPFLREMLDVFVVSISVAMAFRAYWFEPFNIPTGSMMPTLYGIHSTPARPEDATLWDIQPLRFFKWAVTGKRFVTVKAPCSGEMRLEPQGAGTCLVTVAGRPAGEVPMDAVLHSSVRETAIGSDGAPVEYMRRRPDALRGTGPNGELTEPGTGRYYVSATAGRHVREGDILWCGTVMPGDFLFVNRFAWNFMRPKRGEVMVFNTTGVGKPGQLQQHTHYIKRMVGLPGEEIAIDAPNLIVDGKPVTEGGRIGQIVRKERIADWAPWKYAGYVNDGDLMSEPGRSVRLGADEYFACGDNQKSSYDSRYWGPVPGRNLVGRAALVFWPFTSPRWGLVD